MRSVPQSRERGLDRAHEVHRSETGVVGVAADADREGHLVTKTARVQPLTDDVLAAPARVAVGGVQGVPAALDVRVHDLVAGLEIDVPAELGAAEDEREDLDTGIAQRDANAPAERRPLNGDRCGGVRRCRAPG